MCGIFGFTQMRNATLNEQIQILKELFKEEEFLGDKATGLSILKDDTIAVLKGPVKASEFIETEKFEIFVARHLKDANAVIGHCRQPTKGRETFNFNNHPIITPNVVGSHQGIIGNDNELWKSPFMSCKKQGQVDSEAAIAYLSSLLGSLSRTTYISHKEAINRTAKALTGSFTIAFFSRLNPKYLYLFTNKGSKLARSHSKLCWFFGDSLRLEAALRKVNLKVETIDIPSECGLRINSKNREVAVWELED